MMKNKFSILVSLYGLLTACGVTELPPSPDSHGAQPSVPEQTIGEARSVPAQRLDTVIAFSSSPVPIVNTIEVSAEEGFLLNIGDTVGTVDPGSMVALIEVKLGGFHNDPIAYKISTTDGVEGFVTPEYTGLPLTDTSQVPQRYVQARDLLRIGHQGCPVDGPFSTVTIWSDGQAREVSCTDVAPLLPAANYPL